MNLTAEMPDEKGVHMWKELNTHSSAAVLFVVIEYFTFLLEAKLLPSHS